MCKTKITTLKFFLKYFLIVPLFCLCADAIAQAQPPGQPIPAAPSPRAIKRYEIDAKRIGVDANSDDALPRSREFLRIDSSYYVGWFFEGTYKYNHAADWLGFKNASVPLEHALSDLERDFKKELALRSPDVMTFAPTLKYKADYTQIAIYLVNCYSNMEDPEKVFALLQRAKRWNFQRDMYLDIYNWLGWIVHRNRFYTSAKYSFLKNSIDENEALANRYLDSGLRKIHRDVVYNAHVWLPGWEKLDILGVYHYKSILYSYALNVDSAAYYYDLLHNSAIFPHNNFATFRLICGDFRVAEEEYKLAAGQESGDKRLKEYVYYSSIIDIYKNQPKAGIELCKDMIIANGSTPGFGWYNIALARCMYYDGQIAESKRYIEKAAKFKELHIGTTLGQSHYDFSVQLNKLMNKEAEWEMERFENRNWWYNPKVLYNMSQHTGEKYLQQFLIINQLSQNPERDRVIYKLFSTESIVTWDEVWYLVRDFSTNFFLKRFEQEAKDDKRKNIKKYYKLFAARLLMEQGKYKQAKQMLDALLVEPTTDIEYEKLYAARILEAEARCAKELNNDNAYKDYMYELYENYPQLIPYCGMKMNMNLQVLGTENKDIVARLKDCNINWVSDNRAPKVIVQFIENGTRKSIQYSVMQNGKIVVPKQGFNWQKTDEAGVQLAYRIFNISGKTEEELNKKTEK